MRVAVQDLGLETLTVVSPGGHDHTLGAGVRAVGLRRFV